MMGVAKISKAIMENQQGDYGINRMLENPLFL